MSEQIRYTGYRNAKHVGYSKNKTPDGIGLILDDLFLLSLSHWKQYNFAGPTLVIYPNREILCATIHNQELNGPWSYQPNQQYRVFGSGGISDSNKFAILLQQSKTVLEIEIRGDVPKVTAEKQFSSSDEKQKIIGDIIKTKITPEYENYSSFIQKNFIHPTKQAFNIVKHGAIDVYGFKGIETLGFALNQNQQIQAVGDYNSETGQMIFGRKYIDTGRKDEVQISEGNFKQNQIYTYQQKRPTGARKNAQDYFRQSTYFENKFVYMVAADNFYKAITPKLVRFQNGYSSSYGQKIIEADQFSGKLNKEYGLEAAKKAIYSEINKKHLSTRSGKRESPVRRLMNEGRQSPSRRRVSLERSPSSKKRSPQKKRYTYDEPQPMGKVHEFKIHQGDITEGDSQRRRIRDEYRLKRMIQEEEMQRIQKQIETENQLKRRLMELETEKLMMNKISDEHFTGDVNERKVYMQTFGSQKQSQHYQLYSGIMKERNQSPIGYYHKKNHQYIKDVQAQNRGSRSKSPIKGLTSTARTSKNKSSYKGGKRNYRYVD